MILDADLRLINEEFFADSVSAPQIDMLLSDGWRHFGTHFFRYNLGVHGGEIRRVIPLRIRLADFSFSKSQRRVLKRNANLDVAICGAAVDAETQTLFERHKQRFQSGVPNSIYDFISSDPASVPTEGLEIAVRHNGALMAASFFDVGETSISSIYGIFEPAESGRRLGIFTMLKEIEFAIERGKQFYYHGYAYQGESFYDYKKRFASLEEFDWEGNWVRFVPTKQ
jgi:arginine-tRNA-protein transferase